MLSVNPSDFKLVYGHRTDILTHEEKVTHVMVLMSYLCHLFGDHAVHAALDSMCHVYVPDFYSESESWE